MKSNSFTTIILEADENCYLTQDDESIELKDRIVAKRIALGKLDSADNYKEISKEDGDAIKAEQEKLNKSEEDERNQKY